MPGNWRGKRICIQGYFTKIKNPPRLFDNSRINTKNLAGPVNTFEFYWL